MAHKKAYSRDYFVPSNAGRLPDDMECELAIARIMGTEKCTREQAYKIFFERARSCNNIGNQR